MNFWIYVGLIIFILFGDAIFYKAGIVHAQKEMAEKIESNYIGILMIDTKSEGLMDVRFNDNPLNYTGQFVMMKVEEKKSA